MTNRSNHEKILYTVKEVSELIHTNQAYVYTLIRGRTVTGAEAGLLQGAEGSVIHFSGSQRGKEPKRSAQRTKYLRGGRGNVYGVRGEEGVRVRRLCTICVPQGKNM